MKINKEVKSLNMSWERNMGIPGGAGWGHYLSLRSGEP